MPTVSQIEEMVRPVVESKGAYVVGVVIRNEGRDKILEVFADTDEGITTSLCAEISHELSHSLDLDGLFHNKYYLIVSSPGIDRPLKYVRQYSKNIGRNVRVKYRNNQGIDTLEGELVEANEQSIALRVEDNVVRRIEFPAIVETRVNAAW